MGEFLERNMIFYVYLWLRKDGTPYYVGKGSKWRAFVKHRVGRRPKGRILIKEVFDEKEAFETEIFLIKLYGRKDLGTGCLRNMSLGGEGASGTIRSDETRRKISKSSKGRVLSEDTCRRISEAKKGHSVSDETRRKLSEAIKGKSNIKNLGNRHMLGHRHTEESRKKMSEIAKGRKNSLEARTKMSEAKLGKPWTEARRIAEAKRKQK
jgi:hypothetical protein